LSGRTTPPNDPLFATDLRIAIVVARFHQDVTAALLDGALKCLAEHGSPEPRVEWVPGSFELPIAARALSIEGADAVVALGCVIRGGTPHFEYVCSETARGLMDVMLETDVPVAFGVLTTDDLEQAQARAGGAEGNKGYDAALTAIEMAHFMKRVASAPDLG
jgi:6,7-dimethyl-8-ribityllumazine synthase